MEWANGSSTRRSWDGKFLRRARSVARCFWGYAVATRAQTGAEKGARGGNRNRQHREEAHRQLAWNPAPTATHRLASVGLARRASRTARPAAQPRAADRSAF